MIHAPGRHCEHSVLYTQQAQTICITFIQRRTNVEDVGPALYKCYTNVCVCWELPLSGSAVSPRFPGACAVAWRRGVTSAVMRLWLIRSHPARWLRGAAPRGVPPDKTRLCGAGPRLSPRVININSAPFPPELRAGTLSNPKGTGVKFSREDAPGEFSATAQVRCNFLHRGVRLLQPSWTSRTILFITNDYDTFLRAIWKNSYLVFGIQSV